MEMFAVQNSDCRVHEANSVTNATSAKLRMYSFFRCSIKVSARLGSLETGALKAPENEPNLKPLTSVEKVADCDPTLTLTNRSKRIGSVRSGSKLLVTFNAS